jgi:hypothetical protein
MVIRSEEAKQRRLEYCRKYYKKWRQQPEQKRKQSERNRKWRTLNKKRHAELNLQSYYRNKEKVMERQREYFKTEKGLAAKRRAALKYSRKPSSKQRSVLIAKNRRRTDPAYNILVRLRGRLGVVMKRIKSKKHFDTLSLLGCTLAEFMAHIESKFSEGMSWQNMGEWHIDHCLPCAVFDLTIPDQQKACFHFTNLQPLWALDNLRKHKKMLVQQ